MGISGAWFKTRTELPGKVEEKPEAIEISPGDDENPWEGGSDTASSNTLLTGDVTSLGGEGGNSPYWTNTSMESKGLSNGAWFAIGLIPTPIAMWMASFLFVIIGESGGDLMEDLFFSLAWLIWPIGLIGGIVWSFTKGNKYFAFGLLTTLIGLPAVLFLALIVFLFSLGAF